jgi:hypothetical protein
VTPLGWLDILVAFIVIPMQVTRSPMRWGIAALLFAATTINHIDRQTLSVVAPYIRDDLSMRMKAMGTQSVRFWLHTR